MSAPSTTRIQWADAGDWADADDWADAVSGAGLPISSDEPPDDIFARSEPTDVTQRSSYRC